MELQEQTKKTEAYVYGLVQDCCNTFANALVLLQLYTKPSIYGVL